MAEQSKVFVHFSTLITQARLKQGFTTLRELYREKKPAVDYNTWLHAESGRRIPSSAIVQKMANILEINKESVLIAYCKDKFDDTDYHQVLDLFEHNRFANMDALLEARNHERSGEYIFNADQVKAFQEDIRLRQFMVFTYDREFRTNFDRLASFFKMEKSEVKELVQRLESLGLVEVTNESVKRISLHTSFPKSIDLSGLRKNLLLKSLEFGLKPDSHVVNYYVCLTQESYKRVLSFFDFIEANLTKMDLDDSEKMNSLRFQITLTANKLFEGSGNDRS